MKKIKNIRWNADYETYEAVHFDGYIEPLRDSHEASKCALKNKLNIDRNEFRQK